MGPTLRRFTRYARDVDFALTQFIRGQLTVMAVMAPAALCARLAIVLGMAAGLFNFIPYLGARSRSSLASRCPSWSAGFRANSSVSWVPTVQSCESRVIMPRIVGKTVGLNEVWVLLTLFVGGEPFGFRGILLAFALGCSSENLRDARRAAVPRSDLYLRPRAETPSETDPSELAQRMATEPPAGQ